MNKKGSKKQSPQLELNENKIKNDDESEIPYRRSLIIQQFNDFKIIIQSQEEQIKESRDEIKNKEEQLENEIKIRNELNSKIFDCERRINDLESINIFQKNEIDKKDKKIKLLNQEIINLKSKKIPSNDFVDQEAKDMIDHLSKELDEKDLEITKLNIKIQYLMNGKSKENKISNKDDLMHSNDSNPIENSQYQTKNSKIQHNDKQNFNKPSNLVKSNLRDTPSSNASPGKSSTSNYQLNSKNEQFESKNKSYKKIKKVNNSKPAENYEINIDVVAETNTPAHVPRYKSKSPPKLDIPSISTSQRLIIPTPANNENHEENEYDEEEDLPTTSRSAYPQNKNKIIKGRRNTNIVGENSQRKLERDFKSDDDVIKPKRASNKRITRKRKTIKRQSLKRTVNQKEDDDNNKNLLYPNLNGKNSKDQNDSDDSNGNLSYSEHSQNIRGRRKTIKKSLKKIRKRSTSPILINSDIEKNSQNNENSKEQQINANKQNLKNANIQKKAKEPLPNINFDESEDNDNNYQSSDEHSKSNTQHPMKTKKITKKIIRKRVINNERKNELGKANNNNLNKGSDENENDTNNTNKRGKKRRFIKRKVISLASNDKSKVSTNLINDNESSSGTLDSNGVSTSQKIKAIQSMKTNNENLDQKDIDNNIQPTTTVVPNAVKSRGKSKPRGKSKTVNISKQQTDLLNNNKNDLVQLKQQQSQPQINNNQVKPLNYGEGATIASRAAWLNNELFNQQNDDNENLEVLFEHVVATNKAIVRNPRRGVNRRPPTILNDV